MDYCKPYAGRDTVILDRHAADTIAEDIRAFDSQLENHFAMSSCWRSRRSSPGKMQRRS